MRRHAGRVDHDRLLLGAFSDQPYHHPGKFPQVAPPLPSVADVLGWTRLPWFIAPSQAIAIDKDYPTQRPPIFDQRLAVALWEERLQPLDLLVGQPEENRIITHVTATA